MAQRQYQNIDIEDYFMLDENSKHARYEYLDGELRMLAGGSAYHAAIIANFMGVFSRALEDSPCWVYNSDMKLRLSESRYVYPDIMISCDQRDQELNQTILHYPSLVVEVLSPSTEAIDKGDKLLYYQEHPTIQEYVMVDSRSIRVEVYHREDNGWTFHSYGPGNSIKLASLSIEFPISAIYRRMNLTGNRKK